jgi:hypothetical protein
VIDPLSKFRGCFEAVPALESAYDFVFIERRHKNAKFLPFNQYPSCIAVLQRECHILTKESHGRAHLQRQVSPFPQAIEMFDDPAAMRLEKITHLERRAA